MRSQRLSALAVGTLAAVGAVPGVASATPAATPAATPTDPATELVIDGQPGDQTTNGKVEVLTPPTSAITASGGIASISFSGVGPQGTYTGYFTPPLGKNFQTGAQPANTWNNTLLNADATHPGMHVSLNSAYSCAQATGSFTIYQNRSVNGAPWEIEVSFSESCDGHATYSGLIRFNASGPVPPGAPSGIPPVAPAGSVAPITFRRGTAVLSNNGTGTDGTQIATLFSNVGVTNEATATMGHVAWTPLGTRLLFTATAPGLRSGDIAAVRPDGSGQTPVASGPPNSYASSAEPAVSPDGSTVVYVDGDAALTGNGGAAGTTLDVASSDGSGFGAGHHLPGLALCSNTYSPSVGADGSVIYQCNTYSSTGTNDTYRWSNGASALLIADATRATFSPDGTKIAFVRKDASGVPQLFTVAADGKTGLTQVTQTAGGADKPAWSPDGRYLAYVATGFHEVIEIPAAGGAAVGSIPNADDPAWTPPIVTTHVVRESGMDRIATAVAASQLNFADAGSTADFKRAQAGAVVLSRSDQYADALGGSSLAVRKDAPLLITPSGALGPAVRAEIRRVLKPGGTVYVLGGERAVSPAVATALTGMGYTVTRLAGADRYATAVEIARTVDPQPRVIEVATGANYPDALAAGAPGEPLVLTDGAVLPAATAAYLNGINPTAATVVTVGGPGDAALIAGYQAKKMPSWPSQLNRLKLAGTSRYDTALLVAKTFFGGEADAAVATGMSWPDALSGGAMVGHRGGPLLLTDPAGASPALLAYLGQESGSLYAVHLLGGLAALPGGIANQVADVIGVPGHVQIDSLAPGGAFPLLTSQTSGASAIAAQPGVPNAPAGSSTAPSPSAVAVTRRG